MAALPDYKYGKVTGTYPDLTVVSERSESPMVCCGYCSAHMAALTAKAGLSTLMKNEAHRIRAAGGRPHNAGNTASELRKGALAIGVRLQDVSKSGIPDRLRAGYAVAVGLQYGDLPLWLKVQTNDFGHASLLFGWKEEGDMVGYFDPLWTQGARGAWVPWATLRPVLWADGNHSTTVARLQEDLMAGIVFNPARWQASKDIPVYLDPGFQKRITTIKSGSVFTSLGAKAVVDPDGRDASARAVLVSTGGLIPGDADSPLRAILWAKGADFPSSGVASTQDWDDSIWTLLMQPAGRYPCPPSPVPGPSDCGEEINKAVEGRDAEWEHALINGDGWPSR